MTTLTRSLTRTLLAALAVTSLLLAACGGDDSDSDDDVTSSSTAEGDGVKAPEEDIDICGLLELDDLSARTGEDFAKSERTEVDSCQYTTDGSPAIIQLSVKVLTDEDGDAQDFIADGRQACDEGTIHEDLELEGAEASFACLVSTAPSVAAVSDGTVYLLQGLTLDSSVSADQILQALAELLPSAYS